MPTSCIKTLIKFDLQRMMHQDFEHSHCKHVWMMWKIDVEKYFIRNVMYTRSRETSMCVCVLKCVNKNKCALILGTSCSDVWHMWAESTIRERNQCNTVYNSYVLMQPSHTNDNISSISSTVTCTFLCWTSTYLLLHLYLSLHATVKIIF